MRFLILLAILLPSVAAHGHYSFEHADEMFHSGRIDWQEYGPDAFEEAANENKPIFLLLTAPTWCYWCHVYTSDDYVYHEDIYPVINEHLVPIYVDADKRQDLTRQYLEGGWPSTTVMTPTRERLYGYSGPRPLENMIANLELAIAHVENTVGTASFSHSYTPSDPVIPTAEQVNSLIGSYAGFLLQSYDEEHGGFGTGQKFPQGRTLDFALDMYERIDDERFLELVQNTLYNQYTDIDEIETNYNLYDPVEGGFHRYGVERDWSPPHYEKMLYDNARLLKTYSHLQLLTPNDPINNEVVERTKAFMIREWWSGIGFYGNSDVHGEDAYYGNRERGSDKPRVERTLYTDWNSEAIITFIYLWELTASTEYEEIARNTLDFFSEQMISEGAYHYFDEQTQEKGVRGTLLDNSYLLLALVEGYESFRDEQYLESAVEIADYSLDNLYDWHSGGFFERNSPDEELYAPGEAVLLSKPADENGIIAFALFKLYSFTNDPRYLDAAFKTLGYFIDSVSGLDRGYYFVQSSLYIIDNDLFSAYAAIDEIEVPEFWLDELLEKPAFEVTTEGLDTLEGSLGFLLFIALFAGLISFASPCTLPILPAYIANSLRSRKHTIKSMTIAFFIGLVAVFAILGVAASALGGALDNLEFFSQVAGAVLIVFGILMLLGRGFSGVKINPKKPSTLFESFVFGAALGVSWTPCVGPILVAILLLASTTGSVVAGTLLLIFYGLGLSLPLLAVSLFIEKINKKGKFWKLLRGKEVSLFGFKVHSTSLISGLIFIVLGYLIFSGVLFSINQYFAVSDFQKWIFGIEDWLLRLA